MFMLYILVLVKLKDSIIYKFELKNPLSSFAYGWVFISMCVALLLDSEAKTWMFS